MGHQDLEASSDVKSSLKQDSQSTKDAVQVAEKAVQDQVDTPRDLWLFPVPRHLQHNPNQPHHFGWVLNLAFGFATMFSVSTTPYCGFYSDGLFQRLPISTTVNLF